MMKHRWVELGTRLLRSISAPAASDTAGVRGLPQGRAAVERKQGQAAQDGRCPRVPGYESIRFLGWSCGVQGSLQLARKIDTGTLVVLRVFPDDDTRRPVARTAAEQARLRHRNVLRVLDVGAFEGSLYVAYEEEPGLETLDQRLKSGPFPLPLACSTAQAMASVLEDARRHRFFCPDFSGSTIQFTAADELRMPAWHFESLEPLDAPDEWFRGMTIFVPPERLLSKELGATRAADVYRVGAATYAMLAGRYPFREESMAATLKAVLYDPVPSLLEFAPDLPREAELVCRKCLSKRPEDRYPSMADLQAAISSMAASR